MLGDTVSQLMAPSTTSFELADEIVQLAEMQSPQAFDTRPLVLEAIRLAALNYALCKWKGISPEDGMIPISSPVGRFSGKEKAQIISLVQESIVSMDHQGLDFLERFDAILICELLGQIHLRTPITIEQTFSRRTLRGAIYTPAHIAKRIATAAIQALFAPVANERHSMHELLESIRILDPCCGSGIFLVCATEAILELVNSLALDANSMDYIIDLPARLYGIDLDAGALQIAKTIIGEMVGFPPDSNFVEGNALLDLDIATAGNFFSKPSARKMFSWKDHFGAPLSQGGFHCVLFNPPYIRLRPNRAEFIRAKLRAGHRLIEMSEFELYKKHLAEELHYYRSSGEYKASISRSINTYHLFIEKALHLTRENGVIGFIVPSTLFADQSSSKLRKELLTRNELIKLIQFPEASRTFNGVTQAVCIGIVRKGGKTCDFEVRFNCDTANSYNLSLSDIQAYFGTRLLVPRLGQSDWELLKKMHRHKHLGDYPWMCCHRGELDLTLDRAFIDAKEGDAFLIRGSVVDRYHLVEQWETKADRVLLADFLSSKMNSIRLQHVSYPRIACQQISNERTHWRLKFAYIEPDTVLANSCNYIVCNSDIPTWVTFYLSGVLNSELLNWRFSISNSNNHVSNYELLSLPIPDPLSNKDMAQHIAGMVSDIEVPQGRIIPELEAMVFSSYGLNRNDAKKVLHYRDVSLEDSMKIQMLL